MPYIGSKISLNGEDRFNSLDKAKLAAQKHEGTEAIIKRTEDKTSSYELRQINSDNQKEIHDARDLRGNVKFHNVSPNEDVVGFSFAEAPNSKETDIFIPFVDRANGDTQDKQAYSGILTAVSDAHGADDTSRINEMLDNLIEPLQPPELQKELKTFLYSVSVDELLKAEKQGAEWKESTTSGIVGQSTGGHPVNSILSSINYLIRRNRLTPEVVQSMQNMTKAPIANELKDQRASLIRSCLQDISFPNEISQHSKGTCAATNAQILFAVQDPARYMKVITDLASPQGKVDPSLINQIPKSGCMKREPDTLKDDGSGRSISARLIQPALMEYATPTMDYDNKTDKRSDKTGGLLSGETFLLFENVVRKKDYSNISIPKTTRPQIMDKLERHLTQKNEPVSVGLDWRSGGHRILVTAADKNMVYFMNPWGELQKMPRKDFEPRLKGAILDNKLPEGRSNANSLMALSYPANDLSNYNTLSQAEYKTVKDRLNDDLPKLDTKISAMLIEKFDKLKIGGSNLDSILPLLKEGRLNDSLLNLLKNETDATKFKNILKLAGNLNTSMQDSLISNTKADEILKKFDTTKAADFSQLFKDLNSLLKDKKITEQDRNNVLSGILDSPDINVDGHKKIKLARNIQNTFKAHDDLIENNVISSDDMRAALMPLINEGIKGDSDAANIQVEDLKLLYAKAQSIYAQGQFLAGAQAITPYEIKEITRMAIQTGDVKKATEILEFIEDTQKSLKDTTMKPVDILSEIEELIK